MSKTITLNETQVKLLNEYIEAVKVRDSKLLEARDLSTETDREAFSAACDALADATTVTNVAANVFASSVAGCL